MEDATKADISDEKEDDEEWIGYKSICNDVKHSELQFGVPSDSLNPSEATFANLESEITRNLYCTIKEEIFSELLRLCVVLSTSRKAKNIGLTVNELVALKLYIDFRRLKRHAF